MSCSLSHEWLLGRRPTYGWYVDTVGPAGPGQAQGWTNTMMWGSVHRNVICKRTKGRDEKSKSGDDGQWQQASLAVLMAGVW